jgi:hypothetical protein
VQNFLLPICCRACRLPVLTSAVNPCGAGTGQDPINSGDRPCGAKCTARSPLQPPPASFLDGGLVGSHWMHSVT